MQAAIVLALASVALTALAALLVYRISAQHDALQRKHADILAATNAELEVFATRVSHDILSPLSSTRLAIDSALKAEPDEAIRRKLQRGAGGLDRVTRIARALFDFARAGARPGPGERGDVRTVVNEVVDEYRPIADQAGAQPGSVGARARSRRLQRGPPHRRLSNLVRNAITHLTTARKTRRHPGRRRRRSGAHRGPRHGPGPRPRDGSPRLRALRPWPRRRGAGPRPRSRDGQAHRGGARRNGRRRLARRRRLPFLDGASVGFVSRGNVAGGASASRGATLQSR